MGIRVVQSIKVVYPGADESLADAADLMQVTETADSLSFNLPSLSGAYAVTFTLAEKAALITKGLEVIAAFVADGNGTRKETDPADDTKYVELDEDAGRVLLGSGTNVRSWPIAVFEEWAAS